MCDRSLGSVFVLTGTTFRRVTDRDEILEKYLPDPGPEFTLVFPPDPEYDEIDIG